MRKILVALLVLVLSLSACAPTDVQKKDAETKTEEKSEVKEEAKEEVKEEASEEEKTEEVFSKPIEKTETKHEIKDFPIDAIDVTSDTEQTLVIKFKEEKIGEVVVKLPAGVKTPVYLTEDMASVALVTPEGADDKANVTFEKHKPVRTTELTNGLWKVSFTADIGPGTYTFAKDKEDTKIVRVSKYGQLVDLEFKKDENSNFISEEITLINGDKILVVGEKATLTDVTQANIDKANKEAEEKKAN